VRACVCRMHVVCMSYACHTHAGMCSYTASVCVHVSDSCIYSDKHGVHVAIVPLIYIYWMKDSPVIQYTS